MAETQKQWKLNKYDINSKRNIQENYKFKIS
jgi:hypothetical protein